LLKIYSPLYFVFWVVYFVIQALKVTFICQINQAFLRINEEIKKDDEWKEVEYSTREGSIQNNVIIITSEK
jgi:hypothetical protein